MDYFATNDIAAFTTIAGVPTEITTGGRFNATYTSKAITCNMPTTSLQSPQFINPATGVVATLNDAWIHFDFYGSNNAGTWTSIEAVNSAGIPVVRMIQSVNAGSMQVQYWDGAAWITPVPLFVNMGSNALGTFDIHVVCGATGLIALFWNQSLIATVNGLSGAVDNVATLRVGGQSGHAFSQILVSDVSTVGAKVASLVPNSNSAVNNAWANDYNSLVKVGFNDGTSVNTATLGAKEGYGATDVVLPGANYIISSVWFDIRARLGTTSPVNIKPMVSIGGVDYLCNYNVPGLNNAGFNPGIAAFAVDPSTGLNWTTANLNVAELGFVATA